MQARGASQWHELVSRFADGRSGASSQETILAELRQVILDGAAPPGSVIPVPGVARAFGVSRIPVRESLKMLQGEGLVEHRPHSGFVVAALSIEELSEIYLLRGLLETAALASAVPRANERDDQRVGEAYVALTEAQERSNHAGYHRESRNFHLALLAPSTARRLVRMLESAWNLTEPCRPMSRISNAERAALHGEHGEMLDAFLRRDASRLIRVSADHHRHLEESIRALRPDLMT